MIIVSQDGKLIGHFKDYNDLFEYLAGTGNINLTAVNQNLIDREWSFIIHPFSTCSDHLCSSQRFFRGNKGSL
jgi:hypothetical protein